MDSLKQYFEDQRKDNEILKQDIITKLENLFTPLDIPPSSSNRSPTKYCNYIAELCHFEQKINHKLTEIKFELRRFMLQNKCPSIEPPPIKEDKPDDSLDDIVTLKANSSRLISKLDKLRDKQPNELDTNFILKSELNKNTKCFKDTEEVSSPHRPPVACLEKSFDQKQVKNVIPEAKFFELDEGDDKRGLTCEDNSGVEKYHDIVQPQLCGKPKTDSVPHLPMKEEYKLVEFEDKHSHFKKVEESSIPESEIVVKKEQNFMDENNDVKYSHSEETGRANKSPLTIFDQKDSISEVMMKNLIELSTSKSTEFKHQPNAENYDNLFNLMHQKEKVKSQENLCVETKTESKEKFSILEPDTDRSSYYDSESDFSSNYLGEIIEDKPKSTPQNLNLCDSSKEELENANCVIEEAKMEDVEETSNSQISSGSDLDKVQETEKEGPNDVQKRNLNSSGVPKDASIPVKSKSEEVKPVFSAEEKIKKLGMEDRMTIFEKTKKTAVLPDLRLRPSRTSVTDAEKLKHIQNQKNKFEIADIITPRVNACCVFSHVESPSEFYIHLDTEESKLIDSLNDLITEQYKKSKPLYNSKREAHRDIDRYCCAYVKEDKMYYRAELVDWLFDISEKIVLVQLVDYGNSAHVHFKHLRLLTEQFCLLPKLAIRCYLPLLYPPGSTKNDLLTEWPRESKEALFELSGLNADNSNALFRIVYVEKERNGAGVDLHQVNGRDLNTIGQLLIDLGHAVQIVSREDDPMGILSDEEDIKELEQCNNLNEVVLGYDPKDEARICKFTKADGGRCFKKNCKLEHTKFTRGGFTTDQTLTYADALGDLKLPKVKDYAAIRFTTIITSTCFYVNIMSYVENLRQLEYIMNNPVNYNTFEKFKILPARGEIVLVKHWQKRWLRGKVRHHLFNENGKCTGVQVFMVDYGDTIDVDMDNIRHIKAEYLNLPFQAIECVLPNYVDSGQYGVKDMDRFFYENIVFRSFSAKVMAVTDMQMCLEVYFRNKNLGDILVDYGFLVKANKKILFPHPNSVIIPG